MPKIVPIRPVAARQAPLAGRMPPSSAAANRARPNGRSRIADRTDDRTAVRKARATRALSARWVPVLMPVLMPVLAATLVGLAGAAVAARAGAFNGFDVSNARVPLDAIQHGGPPKDGIPAIDAPRFVPARAAALADDDRVLGLAPAPGDDPARFGPPRAYPVRILNWHEVVNDRVGDRGIAVTYCPLCGTGMAFEQPAGAGAGGFGVSGLLYNSDVLLYDRATQSLWSQIARTAISGPMAGTRLQSVPLTHTRWADWRRRHPDTVVLSTETGFVRDYRRDPYAGYERVQRLMFDVQHRDDRYPPKAWVLGVEAGGVARAYPFSELERAVGARGELADTVGGVPLRIRYDAEATTAEAVDARGRPWPGVMAYWFAWAAFHPGTETFRAGGDALPAAGASGGAR